MTRLYNARLTFESHPQFAPANTISFPVPTDHPAFLELVEWNREQIAKYITANARPNEIDF